MTDKQIIIDGVDVSGCCFYEKHYTEDEDVEIKHFCKIFHYHCETEPNCYYKQLKRKEQECEELKKRLMQKSEVDMFFNTPIEGWSSDPCGICKYKNYLTEIKEIAENVQSFVDINLEDDVYTEMNKILQKISECEE